MESRKICVLGAGIMGAGIAQTLDAGFQLFSRRVNKYV